MESAGLDIDWFIGNLEELNTFCGIELLPTPSPINNIKKEIKLLVSELAVLVEQLPDNK
jgi:hypothetical protein